MGTRMKEIPPDTVVRMIVDKPPWFKKGDLAKTVWENSQNFDTIILDFTERLMDDHNWIYVQRDEWEVVKVPPMSDRLKETLSPVLKRLKDK